MKLKSLIAVLAITMTSSVFAAELSKADLAGYYSSLHPKKQQMHALANNLYPYPATDITVVNGTNNAVHVVVPNSPIYDVTAPETNDHIRHDTMMGSTFVSLRDPYGNSFFGQPVCRLAVVSVFGGPGAYRVNVDQEYCARG